LPTGEIVVFIMPFIVLVNLVFWFAIGYAATTLLIVITCRGREYPPGYCRACGYNLTGNVSGVCPECGTKIKPPPDSSHD
jgi:hypothetical protein